MKTRMMMGTDSPPPAVLYVLLLSLLASCGAGVSLHLVPNLPLIRVDSGSETTLQCILNGDSQVTAGNFSWTFRQTVMRPLRNTEDGHVRIEESISGTVSTLTINRVNRSDEAEYSCSYTSLEPVSITVDVVVDPHFKNVSSRQEFAEETDAVVHCPAFLGDPAGQMLWFRDNQVIRDGNRFIQSPEKLTIQNARVDDSGTYQCSLYRNGIFGTKNITVVVRERSDLAPTIVDPKNPIEMTYGQPLDLMCRLVEEKENVRYTWTVDTTHERNHFVNTTPRLYRESNDFVGGRYLCKAENEYGYDEQLFFVNILAPPLPANCSARPETREEGATIVLEYCTLTSPVQPSELTFQWSKQRQNGERINIMEDGTKYSINSEGVLTITNTQPKDSGTYLVNISNNQGFALHTVHLEVTPKPVYPSATIKLNFEVIGGDREDYCNERKTMFKEVLNEYIICEHTNCPEATEPNGQIECSDSKHGTYTATLTGANAKQQAEMLRQITNFDLISQDGVVLKVSIYGESTSAPIHHHTDKGGEIAAGIVVISVVILSVVGVAVLATVIYKCKLSRNHQVTDSSDAEKGTNQEHNLASPQPNEVSPSVLINHTAALQPVTQQQMSTNVAAAQPLSQVASGTPVRPTNLTIKSSGKTTMKPPYGRSLSLELPPRKHSDH